MIIEGLTAEVKTTSFGGDDWDIDIVLIEQ